jgi:hypothetical protein
MGPVKPPWRFSSAGRPARPPRISAKRLFFRKFQNLRCRMDSSLARALSLSYYGDEYGLIHNSICETDPWWGLTLLAHAYLD